MRKKLILNNYQPYIIEAPDGTDVGSLADTALSLIRQRSSDTITAIEDAPEDAKADIVIETTEEVA